MTKDAPGRHHRKGMTLKALFKRFPDDATAEKWFQDQIWKGEPRCPHCGSRNVNLTIKHPTMPHRCREKECRKYFSIKTGTIMESSHVSYQDWAIAVYLHKTNFKGLSSMRLQRALGVTQRTAWFLLHRLRRCKSDDFALFSGVVEVDETYIGAKVGKMNRKACTRWRKKNKGRGGTGKIIVAAIRDRATREVRLLMLPDNTKGTLQKFVLANTARGSEVQTDEAGGYKGLDAHGRKHETVNHAQGEYARYVDGHMITTNGVESVWFFLKTSITGVFHHISGKHLQAYLDALAEQYKHRDLDTLDQMAALARDMVGQRLRCRELTA